MPDLDALRYLGDHDAGNSASATSYRVLYPGTRMGQRVAQLSPGRWLIESGSCPVLSWAWINIV